MHFRRQHPIADRFVTDFFCVQARLCVEIDGNSHAEAKQEEYDAERTARLNELGFRVLRFRNEDVLRNLRGVVEAILEPCRTPSHPSP
jgi:very-short-patch-repair endonuclease